MRRLLFASALALGGLAAFTVVGCKKSDEHGSAKVEHDIPEISIDEVEAGIAAKTMTVIDCNSDRTRARIGVIPGAILLTEDEDSYSPKLLPPDKGAKLVFYCGGPG